MSKNDSITLVERDDTSSEDADKVAAWANKFPGVTATVVYDYIAESSDRSVRGALNGVTVQWGDVDVVVDVNVTVTEDDLEPNIYEPITHVESVHAVHVRPGSTLVRTGKGFDVLLPEAKSEVGA